MDPSLVAVHSVHFDTGPYQQPCAWEILSLLTWTEFNSLSIRRHKTKSIVNHFGQASYCSTNLSTTFSLLIKQSVNQLSLVNQLSVYILCQFDAQAEQCAV